MKPPSLLDPSFRYTPSHATDLEKKFAKIRRAMQQQEKQKVVPLHKSLKEK